MLIKLCVPCVTLENDDTSKVSFVFHSLLFAKPSPPSFRRKFCLTMKPRVAGSQGSDPPFTSHRTAGGEEPFPPFLAGWPVEKPTEQGDLFFECVEVLLSPSHWKYLVRAFLSPPPLWGLPLPGRGELWMLTDQQQSSRSVLLNAPWQISLLHFPAELWYLFLHCVWWAGLDSAGIIPTAAAQTKIVLLWGKDLLQPPRFLGQPTGIRNTWQSKHCW